MNPPPPPPPPNGEFLRCNKHPHEIFTGFCSSCLVERLSAARLPTPPPPPPPPLARCEIVETGEAAAAAAAARPRRTLLYLFHLDDMGNGNCDDRCNDEFSSLDCDQGAGFEANCGRSGGGAAHDGCSEDCRGGGRLQRKRSLRQSCEWIACCETGKDSWVPSRQSWDGGAAPANGDAMSVADVLGTPLAGERGAAVSVVGRKRSHGHWNEVWDRRIANPLRGFVKKPGHMLKRSLSESWRYGREDQRAEIKHSEPSTMNAASGNARNARHDSLMKRLYWLGRSRSVHYLSPRSADTGPLRFYLTPLRGSTRSSNRAGGKRTHLFARGFFGVQRNE